MLLGRLTRGCRTPAWHAPKRRHSAGRPALQMASSGSPRHSTDYRGRISAWTPVSARGTGSVDRGPQPLRVVAVVLLAADLASSDVREDRTGAGQRLAGDVFLGIP